MFDEQGFAADRNTDATFLVERSDVQVPDVVGAVFRQFADLNAFVAILETFFDIPKGLVTRHTMTWDHFGA
jgi:hypothetical protein